MRHQVTAREHIHGVSVHQHLPPRQPLHLGLPSSLCMWINNFLTNPTTAYRLCYMPFPFHLTQHRCSTGFCAKYLTPMTVLQPI